MKNQPFLQRAGYALNGWRETYRTESSFRTQMLAAALAIVCTWAVKPGPQWWAIIVISIALVLAGEMFNTALERTLDGLHPNHAEFVRQAKDCAAGAVLIFSCTAIVMFLLMLWDTGC